ncbi:ABC transporter substrate-binding protein [Subtercola lobariae]|nr:ABC transporter substrate-binding protein [Subtercola lobariae]
MATASAALLAVTTSCSPSSAPAATSSATDVPPVAVDSAAVKLLPPGIASSGVLRVAIPTNEPPTQYYEDGTQTMTGINPDIARLIGATLGLKVEIDVANFDSIIPGMAAGRYDMTVSSMTPTTERMQVLDFVDYLQIGSSLAVAQNNPLALKVTTLCGHKVGLLTGSYQLTENIPTYDAACVSAGQPTIETSEFQDTRQAISALTSGRIDAVFADSPIVSYAALQNPSIAVADTIDVTPVAAGVTKNPQLVTAVSAALASLITSDAYRQVLNKYGLGDGAITDARVNFAQG